jgi:hypothetical protein
MTDLWPWLTATGAGALHGLHPAGGWALAAAWGVRRSAGRKTHWMLFATGLALCLLLALEDAGHSMAPLLWGLCIGVPAGTGLPGTGSWALAASLIAVHVAAWLAVSAILAAGSSRAVNAWRMRRAGAPAPAP